MNKMITKLLLGVLMVLGTLSVKAQIPVTVTGTAVTVPALAASYPDLATALGALNGITSYSTNGTIVFTCTAGTSETAPVKGFIVGSASLNPLLSATNTVTIIKAGGTVTINAAVGTANGPSATPDGMLYLNGADHVTIDGLTFTDGNVASATVAMEFGVALFKRTAGDGCNNNTIQNCVFNMQRINNNAGSTPMLDGSWAIEVLNSTAAAANTSLTPTNGGTLATNGTNSGNRFYANAINNGNGGIGFGGFAAVAGVGPAPTATTFLGDLSNDVGGVALATGNTILNYGGGAATSASAGIRANNQWSINISYNTVNNNNGGGVNHATTLRGIYAQAGTSANATINNNIVSIQGGATTSTTTAIENAIGSTAAANTVTINNNTVSIAYPTATSGILNGILNGATAATVNINTNLVTQIAAVNIAGTGTCVMIETGSPTTVTTNNNTVSNLTRTGASGSWRGIKTTSPTNWTANLNTIENINWSTVTSTGGFDGIYSFTSAVNVTITNNIVRNISLPTTGTFRGIVEFGVAGTKTVQNNQVYNASTTAGGAGGATFTGITNSTGTIDVSNNLVYSLNSTGTTGGTGGVITGITVTGGTAANVYKNKVYDLSTTSTSAVNGTVNGILITGNTANNIYNNLVGDLRATACAATDAIRGISSTSTTTTSTINVYYNTIYLNASSSGANFGTSGIFHTTSATSTTAALNLRNNIIYNTSIPAGTGFTVAYRRSSTTLTNYASTSNNNAFYASATIVSPYFIFHDGTTGYQIAGYKTLVGPRDAASFSEDPQFQSTTGSSANFLKYDVTVAKQVENGGVNIATYTDDYIGTIRAGNGGYAGTGTAPDIGAWELEGIAADLTGPSISYTNLTNTISTANRTTTSFATITDVSGVNVTAGTAPRIYYKKTTDANAFNDNTSATAGWKYAESPTGSSPFDFTIDYSLLNSAPVIVGDTIQYFVVAQDLVATPNVGINSGSFAAAPATVALTAAAFPIGGTLNRYAIVPSISGTITVPGTYPSLTNVGGAFQAINSAVVTGNVLIEITADLPAETGTVLLEEFASPHTITIKPTGAPRVITGTSLDGIIKLNGADRVTIDGSLGSTANTICPPSTATRDLTIINTNVATASVVIWVKTNIANGATNNTVKNCNIYGSATTQTLAGIFSGSSSISLSSLGTGNNNNTYENNNIRAVQVGIYSQGASAANKNTGNVITKNVMNFPSGAGQHIRLAGVFVGFENNITITGNTIGSVAGASSADGFGIACGSLGISTTTFTGNEVINANIAYNRIDSIRAASTFSSSAIYIVTAANAGTNLIANNVITNAGSNGTLGDFGSGIFVGGGAVSTNVYFNSVSMSGTSWPASGSQPNFALAIGGSNPVVNIRNNALSAKAIIGSAVTLGLGEYAIGYGYSTFTNLTVNNNDYFTSGAEAKFAKTGSLATGSGTDVANLAALQAATGQDAASISADPLFNSLSNLQPQLGSPLVAAGTAGTGITNDILCVSRGATPTIGAYETAVDIAGPVITYTPLTNTCALGARTLTAAITDASGVPTVGAGLPVLYWRINAGAWTAATGTHISGNNYDFTFGAGAAVTDVVQYYIVAQDAFATPNVSAFPAAGAGGFTINPPAAATPPTTPSSYTIQTTLAAGTYTVGGAGTYPTLTAAIAAYNTSCLGGAIVFELIDATYTTPAETFPLQINVNADASSTNTLTIRPAAGIAATVTASTSTILKLNGADFVTIDGLNSGGSSLTFSNTNTVTGTTVVWLASLGAAAGATNNTVRNCTIQNGTVGSSTVTNFGVFVGQTSGAANGEDNDNNTIQSNTIRRATIGIQAIGGTAAGQQNDNTLIDNNFIGDAVVADAIGRYGMNVGQSANATVSRNTILNAVTSAASITATNNSTGIIVSTGTTNSTITRNNISGIRYTSTSGYGGKGIDINTGNAASNVTISNNFISDITGDGWSDATTDGICGIRILGTTGGINLYHNTVNLGSGSFAGNTSGTESGALVIGSTVTALNIRDNIFTTNLENSNAATAKTYAVISETTTNAVFAPINYNDYVALGSQGFVGRLNNIDQATFAAWQGVSGGDANSINLNPSFVSATDLHLFPTAQPAFKAGTGIAGIGVDFDNNTRNLGLPTLGADEIYVPDLWSGAVSTVWDGATTGNWDDGVVPAPGNSVTIPAGVPNMPAIAGMTTVNNLTFTGTGATLSLNGQNLLLGGTVTGNGTLTGSSTSNLNLFGTTTVNFTQTNASTRSLNNLTLQGGGPANITLGNALDVYGTIQLVGGATLDMAAQAVTLKSNATNTARIADLTGQTLTGATNVTMERFIKVRAGGTGRAYRLLTPTVNTTGSMRLNWMENGMNTAIGTNIDPVPLYGTQITGAGGNGNGFDVTQTNQSSIYATANGVTPTYSPIGSTSGTLDAKTGYFMYVRGDRATDMTVPLAMVPTTPVVSTTLRATGTILQGTQTIFANTLIGGGALNLITNPYPSPIDWSLVQPAATGITGSYTYWDPNIGTRGGFATVTTAGVSTPATSATQFIQSGQAFFVESDNIAPTPTVSIQESHKSAGNNNGVFFVDPPPVESFRTELYFTQSNGYRRIADGAIALYDNKYSTVVDEKDAREINNWDENIAISRNGKHLAIEARPVIGKSDDLPIFMNNMKKQAYEFEFTPLVFTNTNLKAELVDNYLGTRTLLSVVNPTVVSFTITDDAASKATDRFKVVFGEFGNPTGVDVITIKAAQQNGGVQVDWTSKTETDMVRYEVEKSTYGTTFVKANSTAAFGNSNNPVDYNWFDTNPNMGTNFYRIKGIDKAGNVRYSEAVRVLFGKGEPSIVVYPNPVQGSTFNIDMYNLTKGIYVLNLYNSMGQLVYTEQLQHDGSQATRTINLKGDIGKGSFQLQLSSNGFKTTKQIIKN